VTPAAFCDDHVTAVVELDNMLLSGDVTPVCCGSALPAKNSFIGGG